MNTLFRIPLLAIAVVTAATLSVRADDELGKRATWSQPSAEAVKAEVDKYLAGRELDEATKAKIDALWPKEGGPTAGDALLTQTATTLAAVDEGARQVVLACRAEKAPLPLPKYDLLSDEKTPDFVRNNLRLLYGRWLVQHRLYDEAKDVLKDLKPEQVVDPASLLFCQSVVHHWLLDKKQCLPTIARLLENKDSIPRRYTVVAQLMEADLKPLKTDSLDEIARLMNDIRRRLALARAGTRVRKQEDEVIAKLDKMIEELEKQRQQQQQQQQAGGQMQPSQPMPDSMPGGGSGPGEVNPKKIGKKSDWGNLPPKEREQALQQISKDFPSHYREVIEEYFRKLARDGVED